MSQDLDGGKERGVCRRVTLRQNLVVMAPTITTSRAVRLAANERISSQRAKRPESAGSEASDTSELDEPQSLAAKLDKILHLVKGRQNRKAARLAMQALDEHPESAELMHLLAQAEAGVKWYPHFRDALVHVTLTGPQPTFTIGDVLRVKYDYSHQRPEHDNKLFKPFTDSLQSMISRHDAKLMHNSQLPANTVNRVLQRVGGGEALRTMRTNSNHTEWLASMLPKLPTQLAAEIPKPCNDVGHGWQEEHVRIVRDCIADMEEEESHHTHQHAGFFRALEHAKALQKQIQDRLKAEMDVERSLQEITHVMRLTKLYDDLKQLDAVRVEASGEAHQEGDWIGLFQISRRERSDNSPTETMESIASPYQSTVGSPFPSVRSAKRELRSLSPMAEFEEGSANSDGSDESEPDGIDGVLIRRYCLPAANSGEIDFSSASLEDGEYEFRYYMKGSSTPVSASATFRTEIPEANLEVPSEAVVCGDPWSCSFKINITRPHHHTDWLGVYQDQGTGPKGCVQRETVPIGALAHDVKGSNQGVVHLQRSPSFPGTFHVKYHLGQHQNVVAGVSKQFKVRLNRFNPVQELREIRLFVCSTVADMLDERSALIRQVIPALQAECESRMLTISLVLGSFGMRESETALGLVSEEETATLEDLHQSLQEIDRCTPYFIALLGERYGWIPETLNANIIHEYPWLEVPRNQHLLLPGVRASAIELGILNGFLVDPSLATHNIFFFRDASHVLRTGVPVNKRRNFVPSSEYGREAIHKLREEIRAVPQSHIVRYNDQFAFVNAAISQIQAAIDHDFHPAEKFPPWRRVNLVTQLHLWDLINHAHPHHPAGSPKQALVHADIFFPITSGPDTPEDVRVDERPVYFCGDAETGKSTLIAKALEAHLDRVAKDRGVKWLFPQEPLRGRGLPSVQSKGALGDLMGARVGCAYQLHGQVHVLLVQNIGREQTISTPQECLEHAMQFTKSVLGLEFEVPWDADDLYKIMWDWLDLVCKNCVFIWLLDGIDQFMPSSSVEGVVVPRNRVSQFDAHGKDPHHGLTNLPREMKAGRVGASASAPTEGAYTHRSKHDEKAEEYRRSIAARVTAQQELKIWLIPLLDKDSAYYAGAAYPNLHLTIVGARGYHPDRPMDPALLDKLIAAPPVRFVDMPAWVFEQRKSYTCRELEAAEIPEKLINQTMLVLENEIRVVTADMDPSGGEEPHDKFGNFVYTNLFVQEVVRVICGFQTERVVAQEEQQREAMANTKANTAEKEKLLTATIAEEGMTNSRVQSAASGSRHSTAAKSYRAKSPMSARPVSSSRVSSVGDEEESKEEKELLEVLSKRIKQLLHDYANMDALLKHVVESTAAQAQENCGLAVLILKYLQLSRIGLRENELHTLVLRHNDVSGEQFVAVMHVVEPLTTRNHGLITLKLWAHKLIWPLFDPDSEESLVSEVRQFSLNQNDNMSLEYARPSTGFEQSSIHEQHVTVLASTVGHGLDVPRQECLRHLTAVFTEMDNAERKIQELPLLMLRMGLKKELLELITSQQALRYMGPRQILRYIHTVHCYRPVTACYTVLQPCYMLVTSCYGPDTAYHGLLQRDIFSRGHQETVTLRKAG